MQLDTELDTKLDTVCILGNQDRILLEPPLGHPTFASVMAQLNLGHLKWLESLSPIAELGDIFLCHGSPCSDMEYLLEEVSSGKPDLRPDRHLAKELKHLTQSVILCGHTHIPRNIRNGDKLIFNPGSVGLPAYTDDNPVPHAMEAGSPHARYGLLTQTSSGWSARYLEVEYDWEQAARMAESSGRSDWAGWLRNGTV